MSWFTFRHEAMATYFQVAIAGHPETYAKSAAHAVFGEIDRLEGELSRFVPSSDIARLSRLRPGASLVVSPDVVECLLVSADITLATNGAFDPAYLSQRAPGGEPGTPAYTLDPDTFTVTSGAEVLKLDLGAVGKGYALDRGASVLREWGASRACLVAGGSTVLALDPPPGLDGWQIGIGDEPKIQTIPLTHVALSASGTAVKGSHLVDPRTGLAARRQNRTWALAPDAAQSDALSTAFFVFTDAEIAEFCERHPHLGAAVAQPDQNLRAFGALVPLLAKG